MKRALLVISAVFVLGILVSFLPVKAHEGEDHSTEAEASMHEEEQANNSAEESAESQDKYDYRAQPGDSYTVLARKAVQTYGINNSVNLSGAQIVFAETQLTRQAGSPEINDGQAVEISVSDVKQSVESAQGLSEADETAWNFYVQFVDFNTDAAGQAS